MKPPVINAELVLHWSVSAKGYRVCDYPSGWLEPGPEPRPWLFPVNPLETRSYELFGTYPALFRTLAEVDPKPYSIAKFARRYGLLTASSGESLSRWPEAIFEMKHACRELDAVSHSTQDGLAALEDALRSQKVILEVTPSKHKGVSFVIEPENLLSGLRLQLLSALVRKPLFDRCTVCGSWLEVRRTDRLDGPRYCSSACNMKAHRQKIAAAKLMLLDGWAPEEIAAKLDTTAEKIMSWAVRRRGGRPSESRLSGRPTKESKP